MPADDARQLEVFLIEHLATRRAEGKGSNHSALHAQRDRDHGDETFVGALEVGAALEVVDADRVAADDRLSGEAGRYGKAAALRYKTPALPVIQGVNRVAGVVFGDEDDARAPYAEHARQFENGRPKDFVEVEGRVDERREFGDDLEPCDGDASGPACVPDAEARCHRSRNRSMTVSMFDASSS